MVTGVEVNVGASFTLATVIVNDWVTSIVPSFAVITTELLPTSEFPGVPDNTLVLASKVNQLGIVVPVNVTVSPSTSLVATM